MKVTKKIRTKTWSRFAVSRRAAEDADGEPSLKRVVKSCTMTNVDGQYIAGRATSTLYRIPEIQLDN